MQGEFGQLVCGFNDVCGEGDNMYVFIDGMHNGPPVTMTTTSTTTMAA
jgi:hypothetical protein